MMRILLVTESLHPFILNLYEEVLKHPYIEYVRLLNLSENLKALHRSRKYKYLKLLSIVPRLDLWLPWLTFLTARRISLRKIGVNYLLLAKDLISIIKAGDYDLVHAFWAYPAGLASVLAKVVVKVPVIITTLGYDIDERTLSDRNKLLLALIALQESSKVLAGAAYHKKILMKMGVEENKVTLFTPAVDVSAFSPETGRRNDIRSRLGLKDQPVILFGPSLKAVEGAMDFIKAAALVVREKPEAVFILVGEGPLKGILKEQSKSFNLKVLFIGRVPHNVMPHLYSACDVFCNLCYAGQGVSTLEAMACGKPVIGYNTYVVRISNGKDGFTVKLGDIKDLSKKILCIINNPSLKERMGRNARVKVIKHYNILKRVQKLLKVYKTLIRQR